MRHSCGWTGCGTISESCLANHLSQGNYALLNGVDLSLLMRWTATGFEIDRGYAVTRVAAASA